MKPYGINRSDAREERNFVASMLWKLPGKLRKAIKQIQNGKARMRLKQALRREVKENES